MNPGVPSGLTPPLSSLFASSLVGSVMKPHKEAVTLSRCPLGSSRGPPLCVGSIHPKGHAAFGRGCPPRLRKVSGPLSSVGAAEASATHHGTLLTFSGKAWKGASQSPKPSQPGMPWRLASSLLGLPRAQGHFLPLASAHATQVWPVTSGPGRAAQGRQCPFCQVPLCSETGDGGVSPDLPPSHCVTLAKLRPLSGLPSPLS